MKKHRLGLKTTPKSKSAFGDLFENGWPTISSLANLKFRAPRCITKTMAGKKAENYPGFLPLTSFFFEMDLHNMRQLNDSRLKYIGFGPGFLKFIAPTARLPFDKLVQYASRYTQLAKEKDVPTASIAQYLANITTVFIHSLGEDNTASPHEFSDLLVQFIATLIAAMCNSLRSVRLFIQMNVKPILITYAY